MNRKATLSTFLIVLALGLRTSVTDQIQTVFLERGQRGTIPCPLLRSLQMPSEQPSSFYMYWYFRQIDPASLLISYFLEEVFPQNGIPDGVYDIDGNFSLVVENVTDAEAGTYFCRVKATNKVAQSSNISVAILVSPSEPFPEILNCGPVMPTSPPGGLECNVSIPYDAPLSSLTCVVRNAKPAVDVRWFHLLGDYRQQLRSTSTVEDTVLPPNSRATGLYLINNTYTTSATIHVSPLADNPQYICVAYGNALGVWNGSHMTANILVEGPPTHRTGTIGTSTIAASTVTTTVASGVPPVTAAVVGPLGSLLVVMVFAIVFLKVWKRPSTKKNSETDQVETIPLVPIDHIDVQGLQGILKPLFRAKMQNISVDPSEVDQADAMPTDEIFIELELREQNNAVTVIESHEHMIGLLGGQQYRRRFVVKGNAGCGKTTLVRRFGFDWANNSGYMQSFLLVFVLKMKDMTEDSGLLRAIISQNIPKDKVISTECLLSVLRQNANELLIILDGLDEMGSEVLNKPASPRDISVRDVLALQGFTESCVIVTARPHMMTQLSDLNEDPVFTVIETTGFSNQNRDRYIRKRFGEDLDKAEGLIREVETAAFLETLAKVPIMLRLLCYIWEHRKGQESLPTRITELYRRVINALEKHWKKKYKGVFLKTRRKVCLEKVKVDLGKVAFEGLMDSKEGKLVFAREQFPSASLKHAQELGFFSERKSCDEPTVTFTHKTFQEYFAAYFLVRQSETFIRNRFLSKVTMDTVQEVEYVLRFSCGMKEKVASVIFEHVQNLQDELVSDRYLWVQHLTLMLYYEAQSDRLKAGVGRYLALKYKEEFAALQYYVDNIPGLVPKVRLERLEVYLHVIKDQSKVRRINQYVDVDRLYYGLLWSDTLGEELKQLDGTMQGLPYNSAETILCINQKEQPSIEGAAASADQEKRINRVDQLVAFCSTKRWVCGFGLRIECAVINSSDTFVKVVEGLKESRAAYFGVLNNNLNGCLSHLDPLVPFLRYLELYDCCLDSDDLTSLARLMPSAAHLRELYISGATFTENAVECLVSQLVKCPQLLMLELNDTGLPPATIQAVVRESFPKMTSAEGNIEGQFWLQGREN